MEAQASSTTTVIYRLVDFKRCALEKEEELYKERHTTYINIKKIQDDYSAFRQSKLKAQDALGDITNMRVFLDDIKKWKNELQGY